MGYRLINRGLKRFRHQKVDRQAECSYFVPTKSTAEKRAMSHRQTRMERTDEGSFHYWVALIEEKCVGANFHVHQEFCRSHGLSLSR